MKPFLCLTVFLLISSMAYAYNEHQKVSQLKAQVEDLKSSVSLLNDIVSDEKELAAQNENRADALEAKLAKEHAHKAKAADRYCPGWCCPDTNNEVLKEIAADYCAQHPDAKSPGKTLQALLDSDEDEQIQNEAYREVDEDNAIGDATESLKD